MSDRPRITVLGLGGTIASVPAATGGVAPALTAHDLVAAVPGLEAVADVDVRTVAQVPGAHLGLGDLVALAGTVAETLSDGADGVVVTQGTDTIEDTAFVLDLLVGDPAPVVVTGAMRNPTLAGADGPANLLAAVAVAAHGPARGLGALVVLNDEVHAARFVAKRHSQSPGAFTSYPGALGWVAEGRPRLVLRPLGRRRLPIPARTAQVALVTLPVGDDGRLVTAAVDGGAEGVVVDALGGGHVPATTLEAVGAAARRVPVVVTSTTRAGEVLRSTYGFAGSERDLAARGVLNGGLLEARKARLLLALLLGGGAGRQEVEDVFADPWPVA